MFDTSKMTKEYATTIKAYDPIDLHKHNPSVVLERKTKHFREVAFNGNEVGTDDSYHSHLRASKILPFAASHYDINEDLNNYVVVPVCIMASDLPNTNGVAFPFTVLSSFVPQLGMLAYESWRYQPTHIDHQSEDITQAKGIILDAGMTPLKKTGLWKVETLLAFDREKDPQLTNDILTGARNEYSMGAYVEANSCSICGSTVRNRLKPACEHQPFGQRRGPYETYSDRGQDVLAYWNVEGFRGFETSSVSVGAFRSANSPVSRILEWGK